MEEVIVQARRINTSFWWVGGSINNHYYNNPYANGGEGGPSTPVIPALEHPVNIGDDVTCNNSDEVSRRLHANLDIDLFLLGVPVWNRGNYRNREISVRYNNGGREIWTIVNPSLSSDHTAFGPPVPGSCFDP
jgi:hypothetical protein